MPLGPVAAAVLEEFGYVPEWRPVLERLAGEGLTLSSEAFTDYLATLADKFPIVSIEIGRAHV